MRVWVRRLWTSMHAPTRRVAIGAATSVALTLLTGVQYLPPRLHLSVGGVSPRDIVAPRTIEFVDRARTATLRSAAADSIQLVLRQTSAEIASAQDQLTQTFAAIARARAASGLSSAERAALLSRKSPILLDNTVVLARPGLRQIAD
ncbi:MAG: hypothetical protein AUH31_02235 [Armatimonadetes bacterium 13_1_40CM_64_14]|nr:MAG: hypothetical protein AUH31_02235 [Armatimonadetes bacterium 13_1_40CM_64_14]